SRNGLQSADDYLIANLRFENGVDAVLESSWCSPPMSGAAGGARFEVWGTQGSIQLDDGEMNVEIFRGSERLTTPDTYEDFEVHGLRHGIFENLVDHFVESMRQGRRNDDVLQDGVESIRVCDMISRSVREKRVMSRDEK
ncbi:MAG: Gfo/Idh/MocA family oxidoreductase, partial [Proteobacteria bacterium]|nr:Gfo/Idh/MocA family oxidoreductase [Pseudomonadota bacterium]